MIFHFVCWQGEPTSHGTSARHWSLWIERALGQVSRQLLQPGNGLASFRGIITTNFQLGQHIAEKSWSRFQLAGGQCHIVQGTCWRVLRQPFIDAVRAKGMLANWCLNRALQNVQTDGTKKLFDYMASRKSGLIQTHLKRNCSETEQNQQSQSLNKRLFINVQIRAQACLFICL